jgi:methylphosphotriester-DNA--protein-cysteine methyltransferase
MSEDDTAPILEQLPPKKLLAADRLRPIRAGIRCIDSIETIQAYLAHENANRNRTQVQHALQMRARELRDGEIDPEADTNPVL